MRYSPCSRPEAAFELGALFGEGERSDGITHLVPLSSGCSSHSDVLPRISPGNHPSSCCPGWIDADPGAVSGCDAEHVPADLPDPVALLSALRHALFETRIQFVKGFFCDVSFGDVPQNGGYEDPPIAQPARRRYVEENSRSIFPSRNKFNRTQWMCRRTIP